MEDKPKRRHVITVVVENEPAVLARVVGLVTARGWNIKGLTVAEVVSKKYGDRHHNRGVSRMTIEMCEDDHFVEMVVAQIDRLVPVFEAVDITDNPDKVEADITLVKVLTKKALLQTQIATMAEVQFRAMSVRTKGGFIVLRFVGQGGAAADFVDAIVAYKVDVETAHSGIVAIA